MDCFAVARTRGVPCVLPIGLRLMESGGWLAVRVPYVDHLDFEGDDFLDLDFDIQDLEEDEEVCWRLKARPAMLPRTIPASFLSMMSSSLLLLLPDPAVLCGVGVLCTRACRYGLVDL